MNFSLKMFLLTGILVYYVLLIVLIKNNRLLLKYAVIWFVEGAFFIAFVLFPSLIVNLSAFLGIQVASNAVFLFVVFAVIILLISLTSIVSVLNEKTKTLIQTQALLEKRIRELEKGKK